MVNNSLVKIKASSKNSRENMYVKLYNSNTNDISEYRNWGCCSAIQQNLTVEFGTPKRDKSDRVNFCILKLGKSNIPGKFLTEKYLDDYLEFINNLDTKIFYLKLLGIGGLRENLEKDFNGLYSKEEQFNDKNYVYIAFKMQEEQNMMRFNLASLSFVRFLQYARYWFYVNLIMDLRLNPELEPLNSYEILQLAGYGHHKTSKDSYPGLYYYKSPFVCESLTYYIEKDFSKVVSKVKKGNCLNDSFNSTIHIYDIRYIRELIMQGEYITAYNLLTQPVSCGNQLYDGSIIVTLLSTNEKYKVLPIDFHNDYDKAYKKPNLKK